MFVSDVTVFIDNESFGYAIDTPVDADPSVQIRPCPGIGVAKRVEPSGRIIRFILVVKSMYRNDVLPADFQ